MTTDVFNDVFTFLISSHENNLKFIRFVIFCCTCFLLVHACRSHNRNRGDTFPLLTSDKPNCHFLMRLSLGRQNYFQFCVDKPVTYKKNMLLAVDCTWAKLNYFFQFFNCHKLNHVHNIESVFELHQFDLIIHQLYQDTLLYTHVIL